MEKQALYEFMRARRFAVMASVSPQRTPEAALVGYAVTPEFELVFDTTDATRKCPNLRANPAIAFVIGWEGWETVQYEGMADEPAGEERERLLKIYLEAFPDGVARQEWPGITYFRVRPRWIRFSSYYRPRAITEFSF
ncbi:MAG TPA: pyridoxamine 5'-phosphate oxidase family protein [Rhizomicrobium sp.]|nr:pyridoxamine 5'-phosphate oxidase family protein [Rhizomicrobium sp.]